MNDWGLIRTGGLFQNLGLHGGIFEYGGLIGTGGLNEDLRYTELHLGNPALTIFTDASKTGLGAAISSILKTGGLFYEKVSIGHINVL